jgi:TonB family protein
MRTTFIAAAAIGLTATAAFAAETAPKPVWGGDVANLITPAKLTWTSAPSAADVAAVYPKKALAKGRSGRALMRCRLRTDGGLSGCVAVADDPENDGFAAAALALAPRFRFLMAGIDPRVVPRMGVDVPVSFSPPGGPRVVAEPEWVKTLPADQVQEVFPPKAAEAGLSTGRAVVDCTADAQGDMTACQAVQEEPQGMDLGAAAVRVASAMTVNPWTADGQPVDGAHVRFALRLNRAQGQ